jgi:hypothetical protein
MSKRLTSIVILLAFVGAMTAQAVTPVPSDFAYGIELDTPGQASLWQLWLPEEIHKNAVRPDLGDLRVFDASGMIMPHILRSPEAGKEEPPAPTALPIFPLYTDEVSGKDSQAVRIVTDRDGAVINIVRQATPSKAGEAISAYLIDASNLQHEPDKLILDWESAKETGFSASINIDGSDDLSSWQPLVENATLTDLQFGDHQLTQHEIKLPAAAYDYLRISWPASLHQVTLKQATVRFASKDQPPQRYWIRVSGTKNPGSPATFEFDTGGHWPVDHARIVIPEQNMLIQVELASRPSAEDDWSRKYHGKFYKLLRADGTLLISPAVSFNTTNDRYWRIKEAGGGNVLDQYVPVLELGWIPHVLTFVAQGQPPYTIAYGSGTIGPLEQSIDPALFSDDRPGGAVLIRQASSASGYLLGGIEKLEPAPLPYPWRKILLWSALIIGVVLLSWMVWRLNREMSPSK